MKRSRKHQFILALIAICILSSTLLAESQIKESELKFEIDSKESLQWFSGRNRPGHGPIKPTHVSILHIRRPHRDVPSGSDGILQVLRTSTGQSLSKRQQQFMTASDAITWWGIEDIKNHDTVLLYSVSEEDAKKIVQAYLEVPTNEAKERMQEYEKYLQGKKKEVVEIKKVLPEKQKQADQIESKYKEIKNKRYFSLPNNEAYEKAKETMLQMDKTLDILRIELAGIKEKLTSIEKYRSTKKLGPHRFSSQTLDKLDQMFIEQMIELKSVEAREQAAIKIRDRDKDFVDLHFKWINISAEVRGLKSRLEDSENDVQRIEERLNNPRQDMLPPELYQNKVTIYPVITE